MIRLGVVGAGAVSQFCHIGNFVEIPGCSIVALAEHRPELRRRVAAKFAIPNTYATHDEMLKRARLDAVIVVTQPATLGPIVLDALRSGCHVLSEKPMAHTTDQARRLVDEARSRSLYYAVGFMKRHDAAVQYAKARVAQFLESDDLGPIAFVRAYCFIGNDGRDGAGYVMTDEPRAGGHERWPIAPEWLPGSLHHRYAAFLNVACHDLNLMRFLLDVTPQVTAADLARSLGGHVGLDFGFCAGVLEFGMTDLPEWHEGIDIHFARGSVRIAFNPFPVRAPARVQVLAPGSPPHWEAPVFENSWAFRRQAHAFVADLREGKSPLAGAADAVDDLLLAEQIWQTHLQELTSIPASHEIRSGTLRFHR